MKLLCFDYKNHKGEGHTYEIIPLENKFGDNKLRYPEPYQNTWNMTGLVVRRSGEVRNVIRTFSIQRMRNIRETSVETRE